VLTLILIPIALAAIAVGAYLLLRDTPPPPPPGRYRRQDRDPQTSRPPSAWTRLVRRRAAVHERRQGGGSLWQRSGAQTVEVRRLTTSRPAPPATSDPISSALFFSAGIGSVGRGVMGSSAARPSRWGVPRG
jgi:hypothetical protein